MRRRWHRWRRAQASRLVFVAIAVPGAVITAAGVARSESLIGLLVERCLLHKER